MGYKIPVFLSHPQPYNSRQETFINEIISYLATRNIEARTLGTTDYDMATPLVACRRLILECNGVLTIAFRRSLIKKGYSKPDSDIDKQQINLSNQWYTSPWCQIESAMAFQVGLPILIFRETGVLAEGVLEKGVLNSHIYEFNLDESSTNYLNSDEWYQLIYRWEGYVRHVHEYRGKPPQLYGTD